jgi:hypothetical protein
LFAQRIGAASEAGLGRSASIVPSTVVQHTPRAIETALPDSKTDPKLWMLKCKVSACPQRARRAP